MCSRVKCPRCGKPTWSGCGAHVEQVLGNVPREERCQCRQADARPPRSSAAGGRPSWKLWNG